MTDGTGEHALRFDDFFLKEYERISEAYFSTMNSISQFMRHYLAVASLPPAIVVLFGRNDPNNTVGTFSNASDPAARAATRRLNSWPAARSLFDRPPSRCSAIRPDGERRSRAFRRQTSARRSAPDDGAADRSDETKLHGNQVAVHRRGVRAGRRVLRRRCRARLLAAPWWNAVSVGLWPSRP